MSRTTEIQDGIDRELSKLETYETEAAVLGRKIERTRKRLTDLCEELARSVG